MLRAEISRQGVLAVKLAQTLATRPDLIGDEAAAALAVLQDANEPFSDEAAFAIVAEELDCEVGQLTAHWADDVSELSTSVGDGGDGSGGDGRAQL